MQEKYHPQRNVSPRSYIVEEINKSLRFEGNLSQEIQTLHSEKPGCLGFVFDPFQRERQRKIKEFENSISYMNSSVLKMIKTIRDAQETERKITGANWNDLKDLLQTVEVQIPDDFDLQTISVDEFKENGPDKVLQYRGLDIPNQNNESARLFIDGNTVAIRGQSIFLHKPKWQEALFLRILDITKAEETIETALEETRPDSVSYFIDTYSASFKWNGWIFKTFQNYEYDITIEPGKLTKENVLSELAELS